MKLPLTTIFLFSTSSTQRFKESVFPLQNNHYEIDFFILHPYQNDSLYVSRYFFSSDRPLLSHTNQSRSRRSLFYHEQKKVCFSSSHFLILFPFVSMSILKYITIRLEIRFFTYSKISIPLSGD